MSATRSVEYYRLWGDGTWDTDFLEVPADTGDDEMEGAVREEAGRIKWRDEVPVITGLYCTGGYDEDEEREESLDSGPVWAR